MKYQGFLGSFPHQKKSQSTSIFSKAMVCLLCTAVCCLLHHHAGRGHAASAGTESNAASTLLTNPSIPGLSSQKTRSPSNPISSAAMPLVLPIHANAISLALSNSTRFTHAFSADGDAIQTTLHCSASLSSVSEHSVTGFVSYVFSRTTSKPLARSPS